MDLSFLSGILNSNLADSDTFIIIMIIWACPCGPGLEFIQSEVEGLQSSRIKNLVRIFAEFILSLTKGSLRQITILRLFLS